MEGQENLFNVDFNSISDDAIDLSDVVNEVTETAEEVVVEEETPVTATSEETSTDDNIDKDDKKEEEEDTLDTSTFAAEDDEEPADEDNSPGSDGEVSSPVTPFASLLHEKGFLPNFDEEEFNKAMAETEDPFGVLAQVMKAELDYANAAFINSFPPELIDMAKAVAAGVPFEALKGPKLQEINYNKLEADSVKENEDLQKKVVADLYAKKGFSEKRVNKLIETLGDTGALEEEAVEAVAELAEIAKHEQEQIKKQFAAQQEQMNEQYAQQIQYIGNTIEKTEEIIPGVKMTKGVKDRLFQNMTQIVGKDQNGNPQNYVMSMRQQDPVRFDLAVTYMADITKGFTDWSKITKSAKSNATKDLEKTLSKTSTGQKYGAPKKGANSSAENALMDSLSKMFK
jgi:hypothetical protein